MELELFIVGLCIGAVVAVANDPDVFSNEIEQATLICTEHKGIGHIKTSFARSNVQGRCKDGLKFDYWFKEMK